MEREVTQAMRKACAEMPPEAFHRAGRLLRKARGSTREEAQQATADEIREIIEKLTSGDSMTPEEISLVRAWIIGDAEGYLRMENNLPDWLAEYERLATSVARYEKADCSHAELLELCGILEDAARVNQDIAVFLEQRDRVRRFEAAVADGLDGPERKLLAEVLAGELESPEF